MWWVKENPDHSRGGFQNRDVGKTSFDDDYGPDFGTDFARFSDPPNLAKDYELTEKIKTEVKSAFPELYKKLDFKIRNGFVILTGEVPDHGTRDRIIRLVYSIPEVKEVIGPGLAKSSA